MTMMYCSTCQLAADSCDICLAFTDSWQGGYSPDHLLNICSEKCPMKEKQIIIKKNLIGVLEC